MNVQFGFGFSHAAWTQPAANAPSGHGCECGPSDGTTTAQPGAGAQQPGAQQPYLVGYLTPAYLMAAPQTLAQGHPQAAQSAGAQASGGSQGASASGGHVVSNATNALAAGQTGAASGHVQSAFPYGSAAAAPVGGFAPFVPVQGVMLSPVFVQLGFPVLMYAPAAQAPAAETPAGGQPQPPAAEDSVPETPAPAASDTPADDPAENTPSERPRLSFENLNTEDFDRFRLKQLQASLETSLKLELETREGDRVVLDFSQLDSAERSRFRGVDADGARVRLRESSQETDRLVNMEVSGHLSESEKAAIDAVLGQVIELAREFFGGSFHGAVERLNDMDFDTSTLLDMSLEMSMTRHLSVSRSYNPGGEALDRLAERDGEIAKTLEFFADGQRRLIDTARELLNDPSAVKLVRSLLPPLLQTPRMAAEASLTELVGRVGDYETQPQLESPAA